ncbi:hypothetical protein, partial [Deinococcus sp.]|uniref:hypothetical protein n=1 Tax=Deinococcus sp. TaxID=47478 RepID=UPI0025BA06AA
NGLQSPFNPSEASGSKTGSGRGAGNLAKFRVVGETDGIRIIRTPAAWFGFMRTDSESRAAE